MKTILVVVALESEFDALGNLLWKKAAEVLKDTAYDIPHYTFKFVDREIHVVFSGMGKVNAAMTTALFIRHTSPNVVINYGLAGGVGTSKVGDMIVGYKAVQYDIDLSPLGEDFKVGCLAPNKRVFFAEGSNVLNHDKYIADVITALESPSFHVGAATIATADQFLADSEKNRWLSETFPNVGCADMEGGAIAQVCVKMGKPFLLIKVISDTGDSEASKYYNDNKDTIANNFAGAMLNLLMNYKERVKDY